MAGAPRFMAAALLLLALELAACGGGASPGGDRPAGTGAAATPAQGLPEVTLAWVAPVGSEAILWVAYEGGYFSRNGVDAHLQYIQGSPTAAAALERGDVQFVAMAGPAVVNADAKGADELIVMGFVNQPAFVLMVAPGIHSPEQLKGGTIAVSKAGSSDEFMLDEALQHLHLTPGRDVKVTGVGSVPAQVAALSKGLVQGIVVTPPSDTEAAKVGAHQLLRIADLGIQYQSVALVTTRRYVQSHRDVVAKVVRAMTEAVARFKQDRAFAEQVEARYLHTQSRDALDAAYTSFVHIFPRVPLPTLAGLDEIVREERASHQLSGNVDVQAMVDTSFVKELQESGFIQGLYR
jgi:NitT/TauT family transport system substrate-binding protein